MYVVVGGEGGGWSCLSPRRSRPSIPSRLGRTAEVCPGRAPRPVSRGSEQGRDEDRTRHLRLGRAGGVALATTASPCARVVSTLRRGGERILTVWRYPRGALGLCGRVRSRLPGRLAAGGGLRCRGGRVRVASIVTTHLVLLCIAVSVACKRGSRDRALTGRDTERGHCRTGGRAARARG
jgi:hypothetical protein